MRLFDRSNVLLYKIATLTCVLAFTLPHQNIVFAQTEECLECHNDPELVTENEHGDEITLHVDPEKYQKSIHGEFGCTDCHETIDIEDHPGEKPEAVNCGNCHEDAVAEHRTSVHGKPDNGGDAANCVDCHGKHDILPSTDPASKVYSLNMASVCAYCHADPKIVKKYHIPIKDPLAAYKKSVHGIALMSENNFDAATCTSCHGSHGIKSMNDPNSPIYWKNVPETCGQCHGEIYEQFAESVHGVAVENGLRDAPVCTDCHGEHEVKSPDDPESLVHPLRVSKYTCERCHASELLNERYGLALSRAETYEESFHGLAIQGGSVAAANCASCHGIHTILPSSDPKSLINPANLRKTCGKCHPDISANVAKGAVHLTTSTTPGRIVQYVQTIYIWMIVVVIGGMIIHNGLDFMKKSRRKLRQRDEE